jgi:hypothetical protein
VWDQDGGKGKERWAYDVFCFLLWCVFRNKFGQRVQTQRQKQNHGDSGGIPVVDFRRIQRLGGFFFSLILSFYSFLGQICGGGGVFARKKTQTALFCSLVLFFNIKSGVFMYNI